MKKLKTDDASHIQTKSYYPGESYNQICVPGCGNCCIFGETGGIGIQRSEVQSLEENFGRVVYEDKALPENMDGLPGKYRRNPIIAVLPFAEPDVSGLVKKLYDSVGSGGIVNNSTSNKRACTHLDGIRDSGTNAILNKAQWQIIVDIYEEILGEHIDANYPNEGFEGTMCGNYKPERPVMCGKFACSYSMKIMPKMIKNHGAKLIKRLLEEPKMSERFKLIAKHLYQPKSVS